MVGRVFLMTLVATTLMDASYARETATSFDGSLACQSASHSPAVAFSLVEQRFDAKKTLDNSLFAHEAIDHANQWRGFADVAGSIGWEKLVVRGQSPGGEGGGAGASAATDPTAPLTQLQFQNVMTFESFNASGYANTAVV